jgi:Recombinase zinc beta ribbon domain/Recombinase
LFCNFAIGHPDGFCFMHKEDRPDQASISLSDRIRQAHAQNRIQALPPPGRAPFGYKRGKDKYAIDRAQAPIVREFFEHFLLYGSLRGAVRHIAQRFNKVIAVSTGKNWLTSPVYRGDLAYQAVDPPQVIRNTHKSLLSRDEAAQVDRLLRRNRSLPRRTASARRSLAGLVMCDRCQGKMTVNSVTSRNPKKQSYLYLRCQECPQENKCSAIDYEQVLQQVISQICTNLPQAVSGIGGSRLGAIKVQIEAAIALKSDLIAQMPSLVISGILDQETSDLRIYNLRTEIAAIEEQLAQLPPTNLTAIAQAISIPQFWLDLSESERRFYFREFIRTVRLDPESPDWKLHLEFVF